MCPLWYGIIFIFVTFLGGDHPSLRKTFGEFFVFSYFTFSFSWLGGDRVLSFKTDLRDAVSTDSSTSWGRALSHNHRRSPSKGHHRPLSVLGVALPEKTKLPAREHRLWFHDDS